MAKIVRKEYGEENILSDSTDKGYNSTTDMMEALENGVIPQVTPQDKKTTHVELETEYEENEISEEEKKSTKTEDIKKCLRAGVLPECYKEVIEEIRVEEEKVKDNGNETKELETRSSEEIRETAITNQTFERDENLNAIFCPAGELLAQKSKRKDGEIRYANKMACKNCKNPCTKCKYKTVDFSAGQKTLVPKGSTADKPRVSRKTKKTKKMVKLRLKLNPELLKKRMQTSEHSQGTMKTVDNHRSFNMRGKAKVGAEMAIYFAASNIRRVCNMLPVEKIKEKIKEVYPKNMKNAIMEA